MNRSQSRLLLSNMTNMMKPDTVSLAQDLIYESWCHDKASAPPGAASEYFDAESFMGSLRSGFSSFASASASSFAQGASFFSSSLTGQPSYSISAPLPPCRKIRCNPPPQRLTYGLSLKVSQHDCKGTHLLPKILWLVLGGQLHD